MRLEFLQFFLDDPARDQLHATSDVDMERRCFAGFTTSFSGNRLHARGLCDSTSRAYVRGFEVKASAAEIA